MRPIAGLMRRWYPRIMPVARREGKEGRRSGVTGHRPAEPLDELGEGGVGDRSRGDHDVVPTVGEVDLTTGMADSALDSIPGDCRTQAPPGHEADPDARFGDFETDDGEPTHRLPSPPA